MQRVLILCTGNSCRSQMAEATWQMIGGDQWKAVSAGSRPSGHVHPMAIEAMRELGVDLSSHHSKSVDDLKGQDFDLVVTVCDNARETCPVFSGAGQTLHWPFDDPAEATGTDAEKTAVFRRVRDEIKDRIQSYLDVNHPQWEWKK